MYRLGKVHKDINDNYPPFRHILSADTTPTYKLIKFPVPILKSLSSKEYTVKNSFGLAEEVVDQDFDFLWENQILILFLLTYHSEKPLSSLLRHILKIMKE